MKEKIETLISKIKARIRYNLCFRKMECKGIAVFSMCSGRCFGRCFGVIKYNDMRLPVYAIKCTACPYFTPVTEKWGADNGLL